MRRSRLSETLFGWVWERLATQQTAWTKRRGPRDHIIILDGTMSSLDPGAETNAGLTFRLLQEQGGASLYYEAGIQWEGWAGARDVCLGRGINRQIRRAYGYLASRYRPGDRIFLLGYSRGAYAARSLAGIIDRVGLVQAQHATVRNIRQVYRLYRYSPDSRAARAFARRYCHDSAPIEMVGVWDTVKALGVRLPLLWRLTEDGHAFHNTHLGRSILHGYQALARDETRQAYAPVLWTTPTDWPGHLEQVWFPGTHGDIGGQLGGDEAARPLANVSLLWMLARLERHGVTLPEGWQDRFPADPAAPSMGQWRGMGKMFLLRAARVMGQDPSERQYEELGAAPAAPTEQDEAAPPDEAPPEAPCLPEDGTAGEGWLAGWQAPDAKPAQPASDAAKGTTGPEGAEDTGTRRATAPGDRSPHCSPAQQNAAQQDAAQQEPGRHSPALTEGLAAHADLPLAGHGGLRGLLIGLAEGLGRRLTP